MEYSNCGCLTLTADDHDVSLLPPFNHHFGGAAGRGEERRGEERCVLKKEETNVNKAKFYPSGMKSLSRSQAHIVSIVGTWRRR